MGTKQPVRPPARHAIGTALAFDLPHRIRTGSQLESRDWRISTNSSHKNRRALAAALKTIYEAPTEAAPVKALDAFEAGPIRFGQERPKHGISDTPLASDGGRRCRPVPLSCSSRTLQWHALAGRQRLGTRWPAHVIPDTHGGASPSARQCRFLGRMSRTNHVIHIAVDKVSFNATCRRRAFSAVSCWTRCSARRRSENRWLR